jgi:DNA-binding CsgD family transcriptional regulator/PAS domain-containing protein
MVTVDEFSEVVSAVYAAAVTPERWDRALVALVNVFGGTGGGIGLAWPSPNRAEMVCNVGVEPSARRTYNQYYGRRDHVVAAVRGGPVGVVRTGTELILPHTDSEFHVDWIRPNDLEDGLFVRLTDGAICHWLGIAAPRRRQPFGDAERVALMRRLVPHLQQAFRTQGALEGLSRRVSDLTAAIEVARHAVVIIGVRRRVLHLNSAAERLLATGDGLSIGASGSISAIVPSVDRRLQGLAACALGDGPSEAPSGGSFVCPRPSGRRAYVVHVVPLPADQGRWDTTCRRALVLIIDPAHVRKLDSTVLRQLYGLTKTEADVAVRVLRCDGLRPVADELEVTLPTVRSHLQHVFDKTDTHRQAELVHLLLQIGIDLDVP